MTDSRAGSSPLGTAALPLGLTAAVVAGSVALIAPWEGTRLAPYRDIAGVWTVCTGETRVPMRRYTRAECDGMLRAAITGTYGRCVLKAAPVLQRRPDALIASISLAYNIGCDGFARSTVAQRLNAGDWRSGCDSFRAWNGVTVNRPNPAQKCRQLKNGKWFCEVQGLVNRREAERAVCLKGA